MRTHRATVLFGILAVGLMLTQQACLRGRPSNAPVAFTAPTTAGAPAAGNPAGQIPVGRQLVIRPARSTESIVVLDDRGRLGLTDGEAEHGMFVLTRVGDRYLIKTAKPGAGGEPSCLGVRNNGRGPLTVEAAACDTGRAGQLFTITRQPAGGRGGDPTYAISNRDAYLQVSGSGLIAEELGDAPLRTTYAFVDNGPAVLSSLE